MTKTFFLFSTAIVLVLSACKEPPILEDEPAQSDAVTDRLIKEQFIKANQKLMNKENDQMDSYAKSHKMPFYRTSSGIRYFVYKPSAKGDSIRDSMRVEVDFEIRLLDGTLCYTSKSSGKKTIAVGHDDVESGIHKGLQYLKRGDKALLMIPSPLAHGVLGDFDKIPPQMPILLDVVIY